MPNEKKKNPNPRPHKNSGPSILCKLGTYLLLAVLECKAHEEDVISAPLLVLHVVKTNHVNQSKQQT